MIDWNLMWKRSLFASRQGCLENDYEKDDAADRYDKSEAIRQDGERRAVALEIDPTWTVLDIGSGPGTLALPLARRAEMVTVVEPSPAMVKRLKRHIAEEGFSNIRILPDKWENLSDDEVGQHDVVIASYSLAFLDLRGGPFKDGPAGQKAGLPLLVCGCALLGTDSGRPPYTDLRAGICSQPDVRCPLQLALQPRDLSECAGTGGNLFS